jgi:D-alanine--poly(phosphoribitol) ligase subunit 2
MNNTEYRQIKADLVTLLQQKLNVEIPSPEVDLFETGILDSQKFVELLLHIEQQFATQITTEDFEIENFRCVDKIAALIIRHRNAAQSASDTTAPALERT